MYEVVGQPEFVDKFEARLYKVNDFNKLLNSYSFIVGKVMDAGTSKKISFPLLGCGGILLVFSMMSALFGAFHVIIDPGGKISGDEALPAMLGGGCCSFVSLLLVGAGVFLFMKSRQEDKPTEQA